MAVETLQTATMISWSHHFDIVVMESSIHSCKIENAHYIERMHAVMSNHPIYKLQSLHNGIIIVSSSNHPLQNNATIGIMYIHIVNNANEY